MSSRPPCLYVSSKQARIDAIADAAADWREPDHPPRETAVADTLEAPNRWTEEALDYALNRWMQRLTPEALVDWLGDGGPAAQATVGVCTARPAPSWGSGTPWRCGPRGTRISGTRPTPRPPCFPHLRGP
jgi:hypothetical protein